MPSNCLIQALKYRLLYGYTIFYVKPHESDGKLHFCWYDKKLKCYKHYTNKKGQLNRFAILFFGYIADFPNKPERFKLVKFL